MRSSLVYAFAALVPSVVKPQVPAAAVAPAPPAASSASPLQASTAQVRRDDIGFSFSLPADWEVVAMPAARKPVMPYPSLVTGPKGDACVEVALTAKHGEPASVVVVMVLPFACYGQTMAASDLDNFGEGASEGMKQAFDLTGAAQTTYSLGTHRIWIERAKGNPKNQAESSFMYEISCAVLKKGAACWMTMAADATSLQAFEQAEVSLDGETATNLVPMTVFLPSKPK